MLRLSNQAFGVLVWLLGCSAAVAASVTLDAWQQNLLIGVHDRDIGNLDDSIATLERAVLEAPESTSRTYARTELGVSLAQTGRLVDAKAALEVAYLEASDWQRYGVALALGNLAVRSHDNAQAERYYRDVIALAPAGPDGGGTRAIAELGLTSLQRPLQRLGALERLLPEMESMSHPPDRTRALFSLGVQAGESLEQAQIIRSPEVDRALRLSYRGLHSSEQWALQADDVALAVDAANGDNCTSRKGALLKPTRSIARGSSKPTGCPRGRGSCHWCDWNGARHAWHSGAVSFPEQSRAICAPHDFLEAMSQDLPIEDGRGHSVLQTLQRPVIAGLTDLLLQGVDELQPDAQQMRLESAVHLTEQAHQAELQDYLGDRCSVASVQAAGPETLDSGIAVIYPIVLKDRLEVIVRTRHGLLHHAAPVSAAAVAAEIQLFRSGLLDMGSPEYVVRAQNICMSG